MARTSRRVGVVLFQLGGPDSLAAVEPFLYNLFCDPDIIDFPFSRIGRRPLARLIASTRSKKAGRRYAAMGGASPIRRFTDQQASALEAELARLSVDARCVVAMRYWHPFTEEAVAELQRANVDEIVLLPLYPQYSRTTTGSSLNEWERRWSGSVPTSKVLSFYDHPKYLDAVVEKVEAALHEARDHARTALIFSAHSVPMAVIEAGDPYKRQIEETVDLVMRRGGWPNPHRVCYQSKVGASRWLQPSLRITLQQLAADNCREVCIIPISFVSDHVETLVEIDHEAREEALRFGIENFQMTQGLNDSPTFIQALAATVIAAIQEAEPRPQDPGREPAVYSMAAD